jgi:hypothetical protein
MTAGSAAAGQLAGSPTLAPSRRAPRQEFSLAPRTPRQIKSDHSTQQMSEPFVDADFVPPA